MKIKTKKLILALVGLFLGIIFLEVYLRAIKPDMLNVSKFLKISNDSILRYELKPGSRVIIRGSICKIPASEVIISSQGFRDREYAQDKSKDIVRIAFLGDSYAFGWGVDLDKSISKQLESMLNKNLKDKYEVMNCGVPGYNLIQEVRFLEKKVIKFNPNVVIFFITGNDIFEPIELLRKNRFIDFFYRFSYAYRYLYFDIYEYTNKKNMSKEKMRKRVDQVNNYLKKIKNIVSGMDTVVFVVRDKHEWMDIIYDICEKDGFYLLDCSQVLEQFGEKIFIADHDEHFNKLGSKIIARKLCGFLRIILGTEIFRHEVERGED